MHLVKQLHKVAATEAAAGMSGTTWYEIMKHDGMLMLPCAVCLPRSISCSVRTCIMKDTAICVVWLELVCSLHNCNVRNSQKQVMLDCKVLAAVMPSGSRYICAMSLSIKEIGAWDAPPQL